MKRHFSDDICFSTVESGTDTQQTNSFFPIDTGVELQLLLDQYRTGNNQPIDVSFRELVPWVYGGTRASHYLHTYPAKLLPQIAHFFLANQILCPRRGVVLDPFAGSGTVALESVLSGRDAHFCDVNPFARFLTKVKTTPVVDKEIDEVKTKVKLFYNRCKKGSIPDVVNIDYWYNVETASNLARLKASIDSMSCSNIRDLLYVCFSSVARKVSRANPRFSVPVRLKEDGQLVDVIADSDAVWLSFEKTIQKARRQVSKLSQHSSLGEAILVAENVLSLDKSWPVNTAKFGQVDMVITSPPYAGAQKYVRATSLTMGWLEQVRANELKAIESLTLGREHLPKATIDALEMTAIDSADRVINSIAKDNPTRAAIASVFLNEMKIAAENIMAALKDGGYAVVVTADNTICSRKFETTRFISKLFSNAGGVKILELKDKIVSRSLQTKRASSSSSISHETVTIFRKE